MNDDYGVEDAWDFDVNIKWWQWPVAIVTTIVIFPFIVVYTAVELIRTWKGN